MIKWKDLNGNNKVFIEDSICNNDSFSITNKESNNIFYIKDPNNLFDVRFTKQGITIKNVVYFTFCNINEEENKIILTNDSKHMDYKLSEIDLQYDELVSVSYDSGFIIVDTCKLPKFYEELYFDNIYPKIEISVSDCMYKMHIYTNETEYIDIPWCQTHNNIISTLDHISDVILYLTENKPDFIKQLTESENILIVMHNIKDSEPQWSKVPYKISSEGIYLISDEFDDGIYLIEWQKFFKLIISEAWEVQFS